MTQTVVLKVTMQCEGCCGAVKKALERIEGVEEFDINMDEQKVTVKGNFQEDAVFQTVSKTGKKTSFWNEEVDKQKPAAQEAEPKSAQLKSDEI